MHFTKKYVPIISWMIISPGSLNLHKRLILFNPSALRN